MIKITPVIYSTYLQYTTIITVLNQVVLVNQNEVSTEFVLTSYHTKTETDVLHSSIAYSTLAPTIASFITVQSSSLPLSIWSLYASSAMLQATITLPPSQAVLTSTTVSRSTFSAGAAATPVGQREAFIFGITSMARNEKEIVKRQASAFVDSGGTASSCGNGASFYLYGDQLSEDRSWITITPGNTPGHVPLVPVNYNGTVSDG